MKVLILGADGYLGWPTSMFFANKGYKVLAVDNFFKRKIELEYGISPINEVLTLQSRVKHWNFNQKNKIEYSIGDLLNHRFVYSIFEKFKPEIIIHYAEQPSAPYSMASRETCYETQQNNVLGNVNILFAIKKYCPDAHLIKLGTLGEYGTPNIDIEEGWLDLEHNGRKDRVMYPKKPGSFYHLSKVHDSNNIEFTCRIWGLKATDLNQGVVYGFHTKETKLDSKLETSFHYDEIFGTVINRFITQALAGCDLTVYGNGTQERGYLNIEDTLRCVLLAAENSPKPSEFRVFNQFTEKFSINNIAKKIIDALSPKNDDSIKISKVKNPRIEMENHYYNPKNSGLISLGLRPITFSEKLIQDVYNSIKIYKDRIDTDLIHPKVKWKK
tara:strand:+ start:6968 stop:8122 length:1155 start_codon:yes stop_codon:yes gene_type:complete